MRKLFAVVAVLLIYPIVAAAQDAPKYEVFAGYSYQNFGEATSLRRASLNGWEASVTANITDNVGVELDVSGHYGETKSGDPGFVIFPGLQPAKFDVRQHAFLIGPHLAGDIGRVRPFGHALIGLTNREVGLQGVPGRDDETRLTGAFGGGLDVRLTDSVSLRAVQADYLVTSFGSENQHSARVSAGIVFTFGR
jgi:hypothetical protein